MAKRSLTGTEQTSSHHVIAATQALEGFAEDLGTLLGHAQNKAESWLNQRDAIAAQLTSLQETASRLLEQLGVASTSAVRPGRPRKADVGASARSMPVKPGRRRKRRTMSAEARAKIAAAQRARWARQKKAANK